MTGPPQNLSPRRKLAVPRRTETVSKDGATRRFLGYTANLSQSGAFIQCSNSRPVGTKLRLVLHLSRAAVDVLELEAEVIWVRGYGGKRGPCPGMGIRFAGLPTELKLRLKKFCQEYDPVPGPIDPTPRKERRRGG
jgi:Tfp pilus assembly protein PilZ